MKVLVTGSSGHLGEALMRKLRHSAHHPFGVDVSPSPYTDRIGSIVDREFVRGCMKDCDAVIHTATLHKPHVGTHSRQAFVDTNISGTLNLLEEAAANDCRGFVFTSTTSTFGDAMRPAAGEAAVWVTESLAPRPKNIYGVTKSAAEDLCQLFHRNTGLACLVLKTSRFFMEMDDDAGKRAAFDDINLKVNELLFRRADLEDMTDAHLRALEKVAEIGFDKLIITATTPFQPADAAELMTDAPGVVSRRVPEYESIYADLGWRMHPTIERVYDNSRARRVLGWQPRYIFADVIRQIAGGAPFGSALARQVGSKGYHEETFTDGPYPVNEF